MRSSIYPKERFSHLPPGPAAGPDQEILSLRPGRLSAMAFPVLSGIIVLAILVTSWIHYPEIAKVRVIFTSFGPGNNTCQVAIDAPGASESLIHPGQPVKLQFDAYPSSNGRYTEGILRDIDRTGDPYNLTANLYLPAGLTSSKGDTIPHRQGLKADMLVTIKDMRLLQRVFYHSVSGGLP